MGKGCPGNGRFGSHFQAQDVGDVLDYSREDGPVHGVGDGVPPFAKGHF